MVQVIQLMTMSGRLYALDSNGIIWTREANEATGKYQWLIVPGPFTTPPIGGKEDNGEN